MTRLAELMEQHGISNKQMAEQLGVSTASVSYWRSGARPLPLARATEIAEGFGLQASEFAGQVTLMAGSEFDPANAFGWTVHDNGPLGHIGDSWAHRIHVIAEMLDVCPDDLALAALGQRKLTVEEAKAFMATYLPGINPAFLERCTQGERDEEVIFVECFFDEKSRVMTFDEARMKLLEWEQHWEDSETGADLCDGRPLPAQWQRIYELYPSAR